MAVLCKMCISLTQVLGSLVQCCPCHGSSEHLSNTLDPPKQQRSAARLGLQAAELRVWQERTRAFTRGRAGSVCAER